jgi:hypothetical protein
MEYAKLLLNNITVHSQLVKYLIFTTNIAQHTVQMPVYTKCTGAFLARQCRIRYEAMTESQKHLIGSHKQKLLNETGG